MALDSPFLLAADGHNLLFRSFSSVPRSIVDPEGRPVNGVYGLMGTLLKLIRERRPTFAAVAFDVPEVPTFRHEAFPAYQGQRGPLGGIDAENFAWQIQQAKETLTYFGISHLQAPGYEADDVLGTLVTMASGQGVPSVVVSNDRDLQQLVQPLVKVLIPGKAPLEIGIDQVAERLGVRPHQIVDWKVLAGDASDNIPGIDGIGDKGAIALLKEFDSVQNIYENLDSVPTRYRRALEGGRGLVEGLKLVVTIRSDLELDVALDDLTLDYSRLPDRAGEALRAVGLRPE